VRNVPFGLLWPLFHRARLQTQDSVRRDEGRGIAKENQRYGNNNNDINPIRLFSSTAHIGYIHTYCLYIRRSGRERERRGIMNPRAASGSRCIPALGESSCPRGLFGLLLRSSYPNYHVLYEGQKHSHYVVFTRSVLLFSHATTVPQYNSEKGDIIVAAERTGQSTIATPWRAQNPRLWHWEARLGASARRGWL
jgi:hypothetical protein